MKKLFYTILIIAALSGCCKSRDYSISVGEYKSRDFNAVHGTNIEIYSLNNKELYFIPDAGKLDSLIKNKVFDTAASTLKTLKSIDFTKHSLIVGSLKYNGDYRGYNCYVNHTSKEITVPISYYYNCGAASYQTSKFVAFLIPNLSKSYTLIK